MKRLFVFALLLLAVSSTYLVSQDNTNDEKAIKKAINELCQMWTADNGGNKFKEIADEKYISYGPGQVFTRNDFISIINSLTSTSRPLKVIHNVNKIIIKGSTAFEYGVMEMTNKDKTITNMEIVNIFVKNSADWKLIANLPIDELREVISK
jgi:hypothetical protein